MSLPAVCLLALTALFAAAATFAHAASQNSTDVDDASSKPTKSANNSTAKAIPVTIDDYVRAETDETFKRCD